MRQVDTGTRLDLYPLQHADWSRLFCYSIFAFPFHKKAKRYYAFQRYILAVYPFIFSCGITHFTDATMFWYPAYRFSAMVLFMTAIVSWAAVIGLHKIIPVALSFKSPAQLETIIQERTAELEKTNAELVKLNQQLVEANQKTELLMRQKDEFLNIASHELKTPVTSIKAPYRL
jgi:signal transduction histidine kinase